MGVTECDNMLMLLGVSNKMTEKVGGHNCCVSIIMLINLLMALMHPCQA